MPIYEYSCKMCDTTTQRERKPEDRRRKTKCTGCGSFQTELIISNCGFCLLGGGWAESGYSAGKPKKTK